MHKQIKKSKLLAMIREELNRAAISLQQESMTNHDTWRQLGKEQIDMCSMCSGTGDVRCPSCAEVTGEIIPGCESCNGSGRVPCEVCAAEAREVDL